MSIAANIRLIPETNTYELVLPDSVKNSFDLRDQNGTMLSIRHSNRMQLEWLSQNILSMFDKLNDIRTVSRKRLAKRKRVCLVTLGISLLVFVFKSQISSLLHTTTLYVNLIAFGVAIICCLQLLKYVALGISDINRGDFSGDPEIGHIKEMILKDYSDL